MRSRVWYVLSIFVLVSAALVAIGCSHDTLDSGSQDLRVTLRPSPAGTGRYERASFIITKNFRALPADPAAAALFGTEQLVFRVDVSPFTADLTQTQDIPFSNIGLSAGAYRVTRIEFTPLVLVDTNVSPTPATCIEGIAVIDGSQPAGGVPSTFLITDPPGLTFTIRPGQTTLALTVNVPGLIAGYEAAYTCAPGCGAGGAPCLTAFNETAYRAAFLANVTLEE